MLVQLDRVTFGYTGDPVLSDVSLLLHERERVGFIGANGEGKTTLLRLILGQLSPDAGTVTRKSGCSFGYLEQSGGLESGNTVYGAMEEVFAEDRALLTRLQETQEEMAQAKGEELIRLSARCESLEKRIAARDSYRFDVRIRTVLNGMGFSARYDQRVETMSGGEKTRLKLCRLLLEEPELLILDEPTNHLDFKTLFWLEGYLSSYKGALLIVSHDRYFLDKLTERTLELERGRVYSYKGNYTRYRTLKAERVLTQTREYEKQQAEIARMREYIDRNIVRDSTARSALSRANKLERMERLEAPPPPPAPPRFHFKADERPYENVLTATAFTLRAEDKTLLARADFTLTRGDKCALIGDNGTGKTTLLKFLLSGAPEVKRGKFVRIGYYDQEHADLDPEARVLDAFWGEHALLSQTDARSLLARAGLGAEDVTKRIGQLSGGQRAKLELALLEAKRANVLFLDEPTNHLDLPAREALEEALAAFDGTILFVSHDRRFIEAIANRIALLEGGTISCFAGGLEEFLESRTESASPAGKQPEKRAAEPSAAYRSKEERAREAKARARIKEIERALEAIEAEEAACNEALARFAADYKKVREITTRIEELHTMSDALYTEYETLI